MPKLLQFVFAVGKATLIVQFFMLEIQTRTAGSCCNEFIVYFSNYFLIDSAFCRRKKLLIFKELNMSYC